jgi:uncharacterized protein YbjT (DUF2867 family)
LIVAGTTFGFSVAELGGKRCAWSEMQDARRSATSGWGLHVGFPHSVDLASKTAVTWIDVVHWGSRAPAWSGASNQTSKPRAADTTLVPPVPIQAIAADDVAHAIASVAIGPPVNGIVEVAGPDRLRLDELLRVVLRARADSRPVIADPSARYFGRLALAEETLIPGDDAIVGPTGLSEWLRAVQRDER